VHALLHGHGAHHPAGAEQLLANSSALADNLEILANTPRRPLGTAFGFCSTAGVLMFRLRAFLFVALAVIGLPVFAQDAKDAPVAAMVESTLKSASGQIRQFAFDGDPKTYFASADHVKKTDHFTLAFDKPIRARSIAVTTGRPKGGDELNSGVLEGSSDGKKFEPLAQFVDGAARALLEDRALLAVRINPGADLMQALTIREIVIDSKPAVTTFRYPIEFNVDVSDAPDMKDWAVKVARLCERNYPMICDELKSDSFKPRTVITMTLKKEYKGVAAASGGRITGSVSYFKNRPTDMGAMIHETVHCVQSYRTPGNPGWLVEGIADYIRFFKYEPGKIGKLNVEKARYNGSYRVSAAFLNYVTEKYDKELVRKLNRSMREGEYSEAIWKSLTKKTVQELDQDWRASIQAK
jgi:hypothetical protein